MTDDQKLREASKRVCGIADGLAQAFGPISAAGLLLGAARGILELALGRPAAIAEIRALADALEAEGDDVPPRAGHA